MKSYLAGLAALALMTSVNALAWGDHDGNDGSFPGQKAGQKAAQKAGQKAAQKA